MGIGVPLAFITINYLASGDKYDFVHAVLGLSLAILLTGVINDTIKICVGRLVIQLFTITIILQNHFMLFTDHDLTFTTDVFQMVR